MKVTFCSYDAPTFMGGPSSWLRRLLPELHRRGIELQVLFFIDSDSPDKCPTLGALRAQGIKCSTLSWQTYTEQRVRWILEKLAENPPDVFVPQMIAAGFYAGRWVRQVGIPTVAVMHSDDSFHRGLLSEFVFGKTAYQLSAIVCVSQFLEQEVLNQHPSRTLVRRIPCGAPLSQEAAQVPHQKLKLVYVGRLEEEQKQISQLTYALCQAVRQVPNTEAAIYGEGSARSAVEQILSEQGKGLPVHLAGTVDSNRIQECLLASHVLVLLSDYEGLPIALMEAMACGVVPVCLRMRSGIPELVEDGVTGLLVDDRSDDFVAAISRLRHEPGLWERLSQAARTKIEAEYSNEVCADLWEKLLRELQQNATSLRPINIPSRLDLPPVHAGLAREDRRKLPVHLRFVQKSRELARRVKRQLLGEAF